MNKNMLAKMCAALERICVRDIEDRSLLTIYPVGLDEHDTITRQNDLFTPGRSRLAHEILDRAYEQVQGLLCDTANKTITYTSLRIEKETGTEDPRLSFSKKMLVRLMIVTHEGIKGNCIDDLISGGLAKYHEHDTTRLLLTEEGADALRLLRISNL